MNDEIKRWISAFYFGREVNIFSPLADLRDQSDADHQGRTGETHMSRPQNKAELLAAATTKYRKLTALIDTMSETELHTQFDFSRDETQKETHWSRDKNLRDVLIQLYELPKQHPVSGKFKGAC